MELVSLWVGGVAGAAVMVLILEVARGRRERNAVPPVAENVPRTCDGHEEVMTRCLALVAEMDTLKAAVAGGIEHVDRIETRIQGAVKRARKELRDAGAEHPGLEAEAAQLSLVHGEGGGEPPVPLVQQPVAEPESSVRGVSPEQLRRVRGM